MSEKLARDLSPVIVYSRPNISLESCLELCDLCMEPQKPGEERLCGRAFTYQNADKDLYLRELAELALKFYNEEKSESFKLLKVCKVNVAGAGYYGLTFRVQQDGSEECPLFRGVVHVVGGKMAMFCGIKEDEEVTLRLDDDDYVPPKGTSSPTQKRARDLSHVIVYSRPNISLESCLEICDLCMEPQKPGEEILCGRAFTYQNADKDPYLRELAELALKLYNEKKRESFQLLKVCKANVVGAGYYGLTFRAQQDGSEDCPIFRGLVHVVGGKMAMFCAIKEDEEVTLRLDDEDFVGSKGASEMEIEPV